MTAALHAPVRVGSFDAIFERRIDLRAINLMRVLLGVVVVLHLWPDLTAERTPVERFFEPWWSWLPVPSAGLYRALVLVGVLAGAGMVLGIARTTAARHIATWSTRVAFAVVLYLLVLDLTSFGHNRTFLVWLLFGLSLLPAAGSGPWWPVSMLRVIVSSVYLTSGGTKLLNPDWRSGLVLWDRVNRYQQKIPFDGVIHDVLTSRAFHALTSPMAIALELTIGIGLWFARTRIAAIWLALFFHLSIEVTAAVQTFSYSAMAATLIWVTPSCGDRVLIASGWLRGTATRLDWLGRFRIESAKLHSTATTLVDRDGTVRIGRDATLTTLSRLPLLFFVVAPVLALQRVVHRTRA